MAAFLARRPAGCKLGQRPQEMREAIRLAAAWLRVGESSPWHVTFRIEDWLDRPVPELRARLPEGSACTGVPALEGEAV